MNDPHCKATAILGRCCPIFLGQLGTITQRSIALWQLLKIVTPDPEVYFHVLLTLSELQLVVQNCCASHRRVSVATVSERGVLERNIPRHGCI